MSEIWKDIEGYEGLYQVSNLGRIKSLKRETSYIYKLGGTHTISEKYIKLFKNKFGYLKCYLYKNGKRKSYQVHRLVAQAFLFNSNNLPQINHKDENKTNNNVDNLEWCTNKYNAEYSKNKPVIQYNKNYEKIKEHVSITKASEATNINLKYISKCCNKKCKSAGNFIWEFKEKKYE